MRTRMYVHVRTYVRTCAHTRTRTCTHIWTYTYVRSRTYVHLRTQTYVTNVVVHVGDQVEDYDVAMRLPLLLLMLSTPLFVLLIMMFTSVDVHDGIHVVVYDATHGVARVVDHVVVHAVAFFDHHVLHVVHYMCVDGDGDGVGSVRKRAHN